MRNYLLAGIAIVSFAFPALAIDKVNTPQIDKGELELEYSGNRTFDHDQDKNAIAAHEFAIGYGVNDWWHTEINGTFEKEPFERSAYAATGWENIFRFSEPGEYWVDSGILLAYNRGVHRDDADSLEAKLLLQKDWGRFTHIANVGLTQEIGASRNPGGPDRFFEWSSRYRYDEHFMPGVEIQSDLGQPINGMRFNHQEHYIGPAAYGQIIPHLNYEIAYLFGVSDAAAQGALRLQLEYEVHF